MKAAILSVLRSTGIGGIERQAMEFSRALVQKQRAKRIFLMMGDVDAVAEMARDCDVIEIVRDSRGRWFGLGRLIRLRNRFARVDETILHFHYALPDSIIWTDVLSAKLAGKKVVVTLHHVLRWPPRRLVQGIKQRIARRCVDRFITTTTVGKAILSEVIDQRRICVIPCGVAADGALLSRSAARVALGLSRSAVAR